MATYSQEFQEKMAAKLLHPEGPTVIQLAKESGVSTSALYKWLEHFKNKSLNNQSIDEVNMQQNTISPVSIRPQNWSAANKLRAVNETFSMTEEEVGAYCRRNGLYSNHLDEWQQALIEGLKLSNNKGQKSEAAKLKVEIKQLKSELTRKEKALAETAALLILKKKADLIWGDEKDA